MLFNSIEFAVFLPLVFIFYWFALSRSTRLQNIFIVLVSYIFYGWWDWRFLSLIAFSTLVDFTLGRSIYGTENPITRKRLLYLSLSVNLGLLGFFKYFNFFTDNFVRAFSSFGIELDPFTIDVVLPVGISFYTFQTLSYTIDIYREKMVPSRDIFAFSAFVSFFPQLVAGPIERATHLLPQFQQRRYFDHTKAVDGMRQILFGLFKKVVIADNCAEFVNIIFADPEAYNGSTLILGAFFFTFQIYGDFSGYSDIAIGTARLFGFDLMQNFAFPYFSRDIAEFWRRWHISLSTWFRDYLYIPLGGSRGSRSMQIRNTFVIFIVSGFWHGANWTFIVWGLLNAIYFLPLMLTDRNRTNLGHVADGRHFPTFQEVIKILATFTLTMMAWIFFRAENLTHAIDYLSNMFSITIFSVPDIAQKGKAVTVLVLISLMVFTEWYGRKDRHALERIGASMGRPLRWIVYIGIIFLIGMYMQTVETPFIYFQF